MPRRRRRSNLMNRNLRRRNDFLSDRFVQGAAYGLIKNQVNRLSENIFAKVPGLAGLGTYADELGTIGLAWAAKKVTKDPKVSQIANRVQFAATSDLTQKINLGQVLQGFGGGSTVVQQQAQTGDPTSPPRGGM